VSRIGWNEPGERSYEAGLDRGVLYPPGNVGVAWNGLVSIGEDPVGGDVESFYFDGVKYLDVIQGEDFQISLEALSAPPEFGPCDGVVAVAAGLYATQQPRRQFGLSYRTLIGSDTDRPGKDYKIHLLYNALAAPSSKTHKTLSNEISVEPQEWTISSVPVASATHKPTAHLILDTRGLTAVQIHYIEGILYGRETGLEDPEVVDPDPILDPHLPTQAALIAYLSP
jgi:hypothetical protein